MLIFQLVLSSSPWAVFFEGFVFVCWLVGCLFCFPLLKKSRGRAELHFSEEFCSWPPLFLPGLPILCGSEILCRTKGENNGSVPSDVSAPFFPYSPTWSLNSFAHVIGQLHSLSLFTHSEHGWQCIAESPPWFRHSLPFSLLLTPALLWGNVNGIKEKARLLRLTELGLSLGCGNFGSCVTLSKIKSKSQSQLSLPSTVFVRIRWYDKHKTPST